MDVEAYLVDHCPAEIVSEVKAADLRRPAGDDIFYVVESQDAGPVCVLASTLYLAPKMTARVHGDVQTGFLTSVATYAGLFPAEALPLLAEAMTRLPRTDENAFIYFSRSATSWRARSCPTGALHIRATLTRQRGIITCIWRHWAMQRRWMR